MKAPTGVAQTVEVAVGEVAVVVVAVQNTQYEPNWEESQLEHVAEAVVVETMTEVMVARETLV